MYNIYVVNLNRQVGSIVWINHKLHSWFGSTLFSDVKSSFSSKLKNKTPKKPPLYHTILIPKATHTHVYEAHPSRRHPSIPKSIHVLVASSRRECGHSSPGNRASSQKRFWTHVWLPSLYYCVLPSATCLGQKRISWAVLDSLKLANMVGDVVAVSKVLGEGDKVGR